MDILYAPANEMASSVESLGEEDKNVILGYHVQVVETLCGVVGLSGGRVLLYSAPPPDFLLDFKECLLGSLPDRPVTFISHLSESGDTACMVTDCSRLSLPYILYFQKPVILFLPSHIDVALGDDKFCALFKNFSRFAFCLRDLKQICVDLPKTWNGLVVEQYLRGGLW